jgi:hypothetical protein
MSRRRTIEEITLSATVSRGDTATSTGNEERAEPEPAVYVATTAGAVVAMLDSSSMGGWQKAATALWQWVRGEGRQWQQAMTCLATRSMGVKMISNQPRHCCWKCASPLQPE